MCEDAVSVAQSPTVNPAGNRHVLKCWPGVQGLRNLAGPVESFHSDQLGSLLGCVLTASSCMHPATVAHSAGPAQTFLPAESFHSDLNSQFLLRKHSGVSAAGARRGRGR